MRTKTSRDGRLSVAQDSLLDELLGEIGLSRPEVFVANVVKCRPPGNRDPQPDEIGCCEVYLREQIEGIRPKLIVLLGRFATQYFLPDAKMGDSRGQPFQAGPWLILPVYHPAAALRNSNLMQTMRGRFRDHSPVIGRCRASRDCRCACRALAWRADAGRTGAR